MRNLRVVVASIILLFFTALSAGQSADYKPCSPPPGEPAYWSYIGDTGPRHWGELSPRFRCCSGQQQSPIDLDRATPKPLPEITFGYQPVPLNLINNGYTIEVKYEHGSYIEVERTRYYLEQFHFHTPSEHKVKHLSFDMEIHFVHETDDHKKAVVGVLIRSGKHNPNFEPIWKNLPTVGCIERKVKGTRINAIDLLPRRRGCYSYAGSLTTPACDEGVKWFVLKAPIELSPAQISAFRAIIKNNNRGIQRLNGRELFVSK